MTLSRLHLLHTPLLTQSPSFSARGQLSLFNFSLPGNVQTRSATAASSSTATTSDDVDPLQQLHYVIPLEDPDRGIEECDDGDLEVGDQLLGEGEGDEDDGGEDEPDDDAGNHSRRNQ